MIRFLRSPQRTAIRHAGGTITSFPVVVRQVVGSVARMVEPPDLRPNEALLREAVEAAVECRAKTGLDGIIAEAPIVLSRA